MSCHRCESRTFAVTAADRRCGFPEGRDFVGPSKHCLTMTTLCALARPMPRTEAGFRCSVLVGAEGYLAMLWRKEEEVLGALTFAEAGAGSLTLELAEQFIAHNIPRHT